VEIIYDGGFTVSQFVLAPSVLILATRDFFFSTEPWRPYSLCKILSDEMLRFSYEYASPFAKCTNRTYTMLLKNFPFVLYTSPLSVQTLHSKSRISYVYYATTAV
jgi:hypothetical protein